MSPPRPDAGDYPDGGQRWADRPNHISPASRVREFHRAAGHPVEDAPTVPTPKLAEDRVNMAWEEWYEHEEEVAECAGPAAPHEGYDQAHIARVGRELADAVYVAYGTALCYGIDLDPVIAEVHRANMRKTEGSVRKNRRGKVLKPEGWQPPDVHRVIFGE